MSAVRSTVSTGSAREKHTNVECKCLALFLRTHNPHLPTSSSGHRVFIGTQQSTLHPVWHSIFHYSPHPSGTHTHTLTRTLTQTWMGWHWRARDRLHFPACQSFKLSFSSEATVFGRDAVAALQGISGVIMSLPSDCGR